MSHKKVEIQNIIDANQARDLDIRRLRDRFQAVIEKIDQLGFFICQTCSCEDNSVVVTREGFKSKITEIEAELAIAKSAVADASDQYIDLETLWPADIADTTGLTDAPEEAPSVDNQDTTNPDLTASP